MRFFEEISPLRILREFSRVARRTCRKFLDFSFACQSSSHSHFLVILYASFPTGKFEDFKALGALLELSIDRYKTILEKRASQELGLVDCKKALEVLPTMPWAAQIQKLDLGGTNAEGTAECSFVFGAPVRTWCPEFSLGVF